MASQGNLSDFGLVCAADISCVISPSSLGRSGLSICPNRNSQHGPHYAIRDRLSPWICIGRLCCSGLREYLSGWIDLMSKSPNLKATLGHLESCSLRVLTYVGLHYLLISARWTLPESAHLSAYSCVNIILQKPRARANLLYRGLVPLDRISNQYQHWR
jgi:hypothetical protein